MATRRIYTEAFKAEAVRRVRESGRPAAQVGRELGLGKNVIYRWLDEQARAQQQGTPPQALRAEHEELVRLRRENQRLREERDFLKRAAAFFAKESR